MDGATLSFSRTGAKLGAILDNGTYIWNTQTGILNPGFKLVIMIIVRTKVFVISFKVFNIDSNPNKRQFVFHKEVSLTNLLVIFLNHLMIASSSIPLSYISLCIYSTINELHKTKMTGNPKVLFRC